MQELVHRNGTRDSGGLSPWSTLGRVTAICALLLLVACGGGSGGASTSNPPSSTVLYTVGVSVSGLTGAGLVLQLNSSDSLAVMGSGIDTFTTSLASGTSYVVSVLTQPSSPSQNCSVTNGRGTIVGSNITNVAVTCVTTVPVGAAATVLYFANGTEYGSLDAEHEGWLSNLIGYPAGVSGSVNSTTVITSPDLVERYFCLATSSDGHLYVAARAAFGTSSQGEVLVYAPTAGGMAMPERTITMSVSPTGIVLDTAGNIYVTSVDASTTPAAPAYSIVEFAAGANGSAAPIRTIDIAVGCANLAIDSSGNLICVPSGGTQGLSNEIQVFTSNQSGQVAPARTIVLDAAVRIIDVAVDPRGNLYVAASENDTQILEIAGGAGGAGVASAVVGVPDGTLGSQFIVSNLRFDAAGNLYVFGLMPGVGQSVRRFAPSMDGFAEPVTESLVSPVFPTGFVNPVVAGFAVH